MAASGIRRVNAADVARMAQVSPSAVSRTFTPGASVAPETRLRVINAAAALGYQPTPKAQDALPGQGRRVAVIMANLPSPFFAELTKRLHSELEGRDVQALFLIAPDPSRIDALVRDALSQQVSGLIIFSGAPSSETVAMARAAGAPVVILGRQERVEGASLVWIDAPEAGRAVARLMLAEGRRRPLAVATNPARSRELKAFAEAMEAGGSEPCRWIDTAWRYEDGLRAAEDAFGHAVRPDAIFTASDSVAIGLVDSARRLHGLDIPRDLSIVGFGDTDTAGWMSHMITTVRLPIVSMIQTAISTLMSRMASAEAPAPRIWLGCDIIQRGTTIGAKTLVD